MCRRTASGVSLTETASRVDAGPGPWSSAAAGSPVLPRGGTIPAHHTAQACRQVSFGRRPEAAPHAFGSGRQPRRPGGCGADRPPRDLPQEILEPLADAEVPRVVDRSLRAQRAALLVVLLDARAFVVDGRERRAVLGRPRPVFVRRLVGMADVDEG